MRNLADGYHRSGPWSRIVKPDEDDADWKAAEAGAGGGSPLARRRGRSVSRHSSTLAVYVLKPTESDWRRKRGRREAVLKKIRA